MHERLLFKVIKKCFIWDFYRIMGLMQWLKWVHMFEINLFLHTWCYEAQTSNSTTYLVTLFNNILVKLFKWMIRGPWCDEAQIFHSKHAYFVTLSNLLLLFKYMNKILFLFVKIDWSNLAILFGIHNYNKRLLWHVILTW